MAATGGFQLLEFCNINNSCQIAYNPRMYILTEDLFDRNRHSYCKRLQEM